MDELPELPFEKVLSYLSLEDHLKARTVSRAWRNTFDRYPVNTLCYSNRPSDFICGKNRLVSGPFAKNFINSSQFTSFFDTFGQTILSSLKHLRLCDLDLNEGDRAAFARALNSFGQLEQLDIVRIGLIQQNVFNLNLNQPMLTSLQLENVSGIKKLTLEASRLWNIKILERSPKLEIVHGESVERLITYSMIYVKVKKLKNLQYLYVPRFRGIDPTFLSSLQLKEIHTNNSDDVSKLFEQKQQLGRADLKIYLCGLLLNGPHDPAINALGHSSPGYLSREWLVCLTENRSRLADEIPFYRSLDYSAIEGVPLGLEVDLLKRFIDLNGITAYSPVRDIERFLNLLKNYENIVGIKFYCTQPQDLFDRLPEHCAVQKLFINHPPSDLTFLFRLKHLIHLDLDWSIDSEMVRRALEDLPLLSYFRFRYGHNTVLIDQRKQLQVWIYGKGSKIVSNLNAAIEFIVENE